MARRYRRKSRNDSYGDAVGIFVLLGAAVGFSKIKEINDTDPQLLTFVITGIVLAFGLVISFMVYRVRLRMRIRKSFTISDIDTMNGVKFEYYLADLLRKRGYANVKVTEKYDLGVDIIAKKDGITWGVQAKRYKSMVKVAAVRQAYTALSHYNCDRAMIVSNSTYSRPAHTLAEETGTILVDREMLAKWVYEISQQR